MPFGPGRQGKQRFYEGATKRSERVRVSLPLVGMLMIPTLSRFMLAYPQIELDMEFSDHLVDIIEGGYDVVVRTGHGVDSRLKARKLGTYRLEVVGSPKYFRRAGTPSTPEDLVTHACLHHRYPTSGKIQRWPFARSANRCRCRLTHDGCRDHGGGL